MEEIIHKNNSRDDFLDWFRGMAMLFVILGHYVGWRFSWVIFSFHIPLFFVISGYLHKDGRTGKEYLIHHFAKLIIPYLICVSIMCFIDIIFTGGDRKTESSYVCLC